jgi:hypothetical protein
MEVKMKQAMIGIAAAAITLGGACAYAAPMPVRAGATFEGSNVVKAYYYRHHAYYWHGRHYPYRWHGAYYPYRWHGHYYHHRYWGHGHWYYR